MTMRKLGLGSLFAMLLVAVAGPAQAAVYLVGAMLYSCSADGTNGGPGAFGPEYQYSTNNATAHNPLFVDGVGSAISFPLSPGTNVFDYTTSGISPGSFGCLALYFSDAAASFNPPYEASTQIPGDLVAVAPVDGTGLTFPEAGIDVHSFNSSGFGVISTSYSGARRVFLDGSELRIAAFSISPQIAGSFAVRLPEAEGASAAALALAALALVRRRLAV
jgi:hypothetical protein